jgi:hypothetical protein
MALAMWSAAGGSGPVVTHAMHRFERLYVFHFRPCVSWLTLRSLLLLGLPACHHKHPHYIDAIDQLQ